MDSERRHQLRENDLAHTLMVTRDFFEQHSKQITLVALTALVLFAIGSFVVRSRAAAHEDVWRQKNELKFEGTQEGLRSVDHLLAIVKDSSDRRFVLEALIDAGRQSLKLAKDAPFPPDRELNNRARQAFEELLRRFPNEPLPVGIALAGLATVEENEFVLDHNLLHSVKARGYLDRLSVEPMFRGLPFQRMALDRLKTLDSIFQVTEFAPPPPPPPVEAEAPVDVPVEGEAIPVKVEEIKIEPVDKP
jgi:hypothetical protein